MASWSTAPARKVSAAISRTVRCCCLSMFASLAIEEVLPAPLTPVTRMTAGEPVVCSVLSRSSTTLSLPRIRSITCSAVGRPSSPPLRTSCRIAIVVSTSMPASIKSSSRASKSAASRRARPSCCSTVCATADIAGSCGSAPISCASTGDFSCTGVSPPKSCLTRDRKLTDRTPLDVGVRKRKPQGPHERRPLRPSSWMTHGPRNLRIVRRQQAYAPLRLFLQGSLVVQDRTVVQVGYCLVEYDSHKLLGRVHATVEVYGSHKSLEAVCKNGRFAFVAQFVLTLAQQQIPVKPNIQRTLIDTLLFDQCGTHLGQIALPGVRKLQEQQFGNDEVHDTVAYKFELLVRRVAVVLAGE